MIVAKGGDSYGKSVGRRPRNEAKRSEEAEAMPAESVRLQRRATFADFPLRGGECFVST